MSELLPRLIRFKDAPRYLGMDRNRFNREVRPYLTQIPIGAQGIAFDRLDLDAWVEFSIKWKMALCENSYNPQTKFSRSLSFFTLLFQFLILI